MIGDKPIIPDNGGRRSGIERRRFVYTDYIPCRRVLKDRRSGLDRRSGKDRRRIDIPLETLGIGERRSGVERRKAFRTLSSKREGFPDHDLPKSQSPPA